MSKPSAGFCGACCESLLRRTALAVGSLAVACTGGADENRSEFHVDDAAVFISTESELLSRPMDLRVNDNGDVVVLDGPAATLHTLSPAGEVLSSLGNQGRGPREFHHPTAFVLDGDTVRVVDRGNFRLQVLALDSDYQRSPALPQGAVSGPATLRADGSMIVATSGLENALAVYFDANGTQVGAFGSPLVEVSGILDPRGMKEELIAGSVPAFHRNAVLPVFDSSGDIWMFLQGEREVRRYQRDGTLLSATPLAAPEFDLIWYAAVEEAQETLDDPRRVPQLSYVADAEVIDSKLWLLLNMPDAEPAVMLRLSAEGVVDRRVQFTNVHGANRFALDRSDNKMYFTQPLVASVVSASLPDGAF